MTPAQALALINGFISIAYSMWTATSQALGKDVIPAWTDILAANASLQKQIDAAQAAANAGK